MIVLEQRIDWWQITEDLRMAGFTIERQAVHCGVVKGSVLHWRNVHGEPLHHAGEMLMALWRSKFDAPVPMRDRRAKVRCTPDRRRNPR